MAQLSPKEVMTLITDTAKKHGTPLSLTTAATYLAIVLAESGGNTNAICYNYDKPDGSPGCSKTPLPSGTPGTQRGYDRGLWQWNTVWNPDISDADAYDPVKSTEWAYTKSKGFTTTSPMWTGSKGLEPDAAKDALNQALGLDNSGLPFGIPNPIAAVTDPLKALGNFFAILLQPETWIRVAKVIAGAVLIGFGVTFIASDLTPVGALSKAVAK